MAAWRRPKGRRVMREEKIHHGDTESRRKQAKPKELERMRGRCRVRERMRERVREP